MKVILAAVGTCAALCATPVMAQDEPRASGGFYAGPLVGIDDLETDQADGENWGVVYGGVAGYDFSTPGAVFGVEAEVTDNTSDNEGSNLLLLGDSGRLSSGLDLYAGIRAGFHVGDSGNTLIYAKAGYTHLDAKASYTNVAGTTVRAKDSLDGFRIGTGVEFGLGPNMALRAEYRYSGYENFDGVGASKLAFDVDRHQGVAALLFKF